MSKILTVYYSRKGENYWNGGLKNLAKGNTEIIAEFINEAVGGDLFEVETVKKYSDSYYSCIDEAKAELKNGERVAVAEYLDNLEEYDTIFIGFPNWWGTMPMVMFTFLEHYNLADKRIIPFCTNEGSGMGVSERDLKKICMGAVVESGMSIHGAQAKNSKQAVTAWAKKFI